MSDSEFGKADLDYSIVINDYLMNIKSLSIRFRKDYILQVQAISKQSKNPLINIMVYDRREISERNYSRGLYYMIPLSLQNSDTFVFKVWENSNPPKLEVNQYHTSTFVYRYKNSPVEDYLKAIKESLNDEYLFKDTPAFKLYNNDVKDIIGLLEELVCNLVSELDINIKSILDKTRLL